MGRIASLLDTPYAKAALALCVVVDHIIEEIMKYDSDTAGGQVTITLAEATQMAALLIASRCDIGTNVDGLTLSELLEEIRKAV